MGLCSLRTAEALRTITADLGGLLYPPTCLLCRAMPIQDPAVFCQACEASMPRLRPPACQRCGRTLPGAYDLRACCRQCQRTVVAFEQARAPFSYTGTVRQAVHAFKYHGHHRIGQWLAAQMADVARRHCPLAELDAIVPVPAFWAKAWLNGWDPVRWLADALAQRLGLPCLRGELRRVRWTASQTRLSAFQRTRNVRGAFRARAGRLSDRSVLLVDDVFTTGSTAQACAAALGDAGIQRIFVLAAASTPCP